MNAAETWVFRFVVVAFVAVFAAQVATRVRLVLKARDNLSLGHLPLRLGRLLREVVFQSKVIAEKPAVGIAHALVFWGFLAFAGFTSVQFLKGLGITDLGASGWFRFYAASLIPFAIGVLGGITGLVVRRVFVRPEGLGKTLSIESVVIGAFIAILMVTFLLDFRLTGGLAARVNWWLHALVLLAFLALIPGSKHFHLVLSPATVFLKSPGLGTVPNLDFEKEEVGLETLKDLERKQVLDAFTCVECGRCQMNCPAFGTGKLLNPKALILANEDALLAGKHDTKLAELYDPDVLWQCTTCGACENQCPVGIEHLPLIIGARRGLVSNGEAPEALGGVFNQLDRRGNIWGLTYDQRQRFVASAGLETFDESKHDYLVWLGCAGNFEADFQKALRSLFAILRSRGVSFGVLASERCTGDVAKRSGNEYLFQELARTNVEQLQSAGVTKIITSCPHCLQTIGTDYQAFGLKVEVVHSAVFVASLLRDVHVAGSEPVTFHDPCYLGRYAGHTREPRELLVNLGAAIAEPVRSGRNPFCCGAGGGLLFEERESGKRISQERLEQLQATGAGTIVTACPFCSIMLKGAQASAGASTGMTDLMTFVADRLKTVPGRAS